MNSSVPWIDKWRIPEKKLPMQVNDLLNNIEKVHTTELGIMRIKRNLGLETGDVVNWCKKKIRQADNIYKKGKNWYISFDNNVITVNAYNYTIITAHKK